MEITLEQIDLIRKRANVGYKEAKEALEKTNGNVVEALADLEDAQKVKPECCHGSLGKKLRRGIAKLNAISMTISKEGKTIVNVPLSIALIVAIVATPLMIFALILALFTGCQIRFLNKNGQDYGINKSIDDLSNKVQNMTKTTE